MLQLHVMSMNESNGKCLLGGDASIFWSIYHKINNHTWNYVIRHQKEFALMRIVTRT